MNTAGDQTRTHPFSLPPLPYEPGALQAAIDSETMQIHHGKHHQGYVDKLNDAVSEAGAGDQSLESLLADVGSRPMAIRNNAGGHWNHSMFWQIMAPADRGGGPSGELATAIDRAFGSLDEMKTAFADAGTKRFGSGWVWLIREEGGGLAVTSTPNQDNPLMDIADTRGTPILGNDVWEHAYYLRYQNRRADYLSAWWQVVNWDEVSRRYSAAA